MSVLIAEAGIAPWSVEVAVPALVAAGLLWVLARRVAARDTVRALVPPRRFAGALQARIAPWLHDADLAIGAGDAVTLWAGAVVAAAVLTGGFGPEFAVAAAVAAGALPPLGLGLARGRAQRRLVADLPLMLEHVAAELRSGGTVVGALDAAGAAGAAGAAEAAEAAGVVGRAGPTTAAGSWGAQGGPFGRVLTGDLYRLGQRLGLGATLAQSLEAWAEERAHPAVRVSAGALAVAADAGGAAAGALDALAASLRDRGAVAAEARALSAQARLSAIVVGAAPFVFTGLSALGDPRSAQFLLGTPVGRICLGVAVVLEVLAALWMRYLLREPAW